MEKSETLNVVENQKQENDTPSTPSDLEKAEHKTGSLLGEENEPVPHLHAKTFLIVFTVCLIYFAQLINVVGAGALARNIATVVGGSSDTVWLAGSVAILTAALSPPVSQAADYWGRKWFLVVLTAFGAVGCIIVSRATSMPMAIAGEVIAGLSYGAQPLLHAVASEVVPRKYRPFAQASCNVAAALGGLVALLVGGAMTRDNYAEGFRDYWYLATALYAIAAILCVILYNPPARPSQLGLTHIEKLRKLDWIGYFLLTSGLVLFCVGLSWSQNPYLWTDAHVLATFLVGFFLLVAFGVYEWKFQADGMVHHGLFSHRNFAIALGGVFVEGLVFFAANNYFAFEVGVFFETDPLRTGLRYSISFIAYAISSVLAGIYCSKTKKLRLPTVLAFLSIIIFNICMATATPASSAAVWGFPIFLGIGLGVCLCALVTAAQLSTPRELISVTSGLMISIRSFGGSIGLAIYNAIFSDKLAVNIGPKIAEAVLPLGLPVTSLPEFIGDLVAQNTTGLLTVEGVTPQIIGAGVGGLYEAYSLGFRFVWVAAGCFTVIAAVSSAFLIDPVNEFNLQIDAPAEKEEELYAPVH